jgi:hypothetical protein
MCLDTGERRVASLPEVCVGLFARWRRFKLIELQMAAEMLIRGASDPQSPIGREVIIFMTS